MTDTKDDISVEECIAWNKEQLDIAERLFLAGQPELKSTIAHLRRLQQMEADIAAKDKILDQHIAALRSVAWAITDKARGGFDDIVAEAKRVRAELETRDAQFKAMLASYSDKCSALALDIANKTAELEACRKDAERYRWLKSRYDLSLRTDLPSEWTITTSKGQERMMSKYYLAANNRQYPPVFDLDESIDAISAGEGIGDGQDS